MEDVREPSAASCKGSRDIAEESREMKLTSESGRRWACSSDPLESHDLQLLDAEDDSIDESSPRGVPDKCSTTMESEKSSIESEKNGIESEKPPKASTSHSESQINPRAPINWRGFFSIESEKPLKASTSHSESQINPRSPIHWRGFFRTLKEGPAAHFRTMPPLRSVPKLTRKKNKRVRDSVASAFINFFDADLCYFKSSCNNFALSELEAATDNFSHENLIGEGGYAEVYKGELPDGQLVAIKRLSRGSPEEMTTDFLSELGIIVHIDHPNLAKLIGYGVEGGMHLVLQLSPHGSLASLLYGSKEKLDWGIRFKVALGTAEGLHYLHEGCQRRIIHKDIKASNILLTEDFEPQISDFGLAKWLPDQWTHHTVDKVEGTFGYLPPEFFMHGIVDEKTDVYAYGVLLLELITGRQALDSSQQSLVMWAKPLIMKNRIKALVDPTIAERCDSDEMKLVVFTASLCIHQDPAERPEMSQVLQILKGDESTLQQVKLRQNSKLQRSYSEELFDAGKSNPATYLNDLHRHMEVVLGHCDEGQTSYAVDKVSTLGCCRGAMTET